jgi:hypothetical protein
MPQENRNWSVIIWTSMIVALANVIFWNLFHRVIFIKSIYKTGVAFFTAIQPSYFPIVFLLATIIASFFVVWIYQLLLPFLPKNWIARGLLIGAALFLVVDLPSSIQIAFTTTLPYSAAQSMTIAALFTKLIIGIILTYTYRKFVPDSTETGA